MTEDEAKKRWCPFVAVVIDGAATRLVTNRGHVLLNDAPLNVKCIGSDCMAWRWNFADHPHPEDRKTMDMEGYCGLAGK